MNGTGMEAIVQGVQVYGLALDHAGKQRFQTSFTNKKSVLKLYMSLSLIRYLSNQLMFSHIHFIRKIRSSLFVAL